LIPTLACDPPGITVGPDGNLWFTEFNDNGFGDKIGRITPSGIMTEFALSTVSAGPYQISSGPDGRVWFTENLANRIGALGIPFEGVSVPLLSPVSLFLLAGSLAVIGSILAIRARP
jgi:virginiamycin B lyase